MTHPSTLENLIESSYDQLFRLALLLTGDMRQAAQHIQQAAQQAASAHGDPEQALLRAMLPRTTRYGGWRPGPAQRERAALPRPQAEALLRLLAESAPATRLAVGLHYLRGLAPDEIAAITGEDAHATLAGFRATAALRMGIAPAAAPPPDLVQMDDWLRGRLGADEATALRGLIFADEETRALRDAMQRVGDLLPVAIAGLFAIDAPGPPEAIAPAPRPARPRRTMALAALVAGVLLASALIVVLPGMLSRPAAPQQLLSAADVLDAAIHRFDQSQRDSGILHERYQIASDRGGQLTLERWYDFTTPNRLAIEVRSGERTLFAVRANGSGSIQYQASQRWLRTMPGQARSVVYQMAPADAQAAMPVLRGILVDNGPDGDPWMPPKVEVGALYLAQARTQGAALLGGTQLRGRDALLLRYTTAQLPNETSAGEQRQVLLSIDRELHALLDVTVLTQRGSESLSERPWYAEQVELMEAATDAQFSIDTSDDTMLITGVRSLSIPAIPSELFATLEEAQRTSDSAILVPTDLPDPMRGLLVHMDTTDIAQSYTLLYEGEFRTIILTQGELYDSNPQWGTTAHTAGAYRYYLGANIDQPSVTQAEVHPTDHPDQRISIQLTDIYSTPKEREAVLNRIIASLTPVTSENIQALQRQLVPIPVAGGSTP